MNVPGIIRQGDVLLIPIGALPLNAKRVKAERGRYILAHGEATGHHHSVVADDDAVLIADGEKLLLSILAPKTLEHQEHAAIVLMPGGYEVRRQREYVAPPAGMPERQSTTRRVRD